MIPAIAAGDLAVFRLINADIDAEYPDIADRVYRFRHAFFVEHLRWEACRKSDGRERDQFDGPGCVHVIGEEFEEIVAYARLLPTTRPHLVSHVYPEVMQGAASPTGPRLYEWTRHAVAPHKREGGGGRDFTKAHFAAVARAAEAVGIEALLVQTHPVLADRVMDMGWDVEPLALPITYDGGLIMPIIARLTPDTLATAQMALAAHGSDLSIAGRIPPSSPPHPSDRLVA